MPGREEAGKRFNEKIDRAQWKKKSYTVAIDLGSSNVVVAVGSKREDGTLGIEAVVSKPVEGVKAGRIDNIEQAGNAIREAVAEVESTLGVRITEAYAGISGEFVRCARHTDHVFTYDPQNGVNQGDVDALFDRMRNVQAPDDETIMERIPQHYMVDDAEEVRNPVGSFCKRLSSTFNFILCGKTPLQRLDMALRRLGIRMLGVFPNALATPEAVLSSDEKEERGGRRGYRRRRDRRCGLLPGRAALRGDDPDGSERHQPGYPFAEHSRETRRESQMQIRFGCRRARSRRQADSCERSHGPRSQGYFAAQPGHRDRGPGYRHRRIRAKQEIRDSGYAERLAYGIVLTGGSAQLKDIDELFRRVTGMDVRIASAETGISEDSREAVANPAFATVVGLLLKGAGMGSCNVIEDKAGLSPRRPVPPTSVPGFQPPQPQSRPQPQPYAPTRPSAETVNAAYARREAARAESAAVEPEAEDAGEDPAPQAPVQEPVKKERNWRSIFKRTLDKINEGFNAADDEEI